MLSRNTIGGRFTELRSIIDLVHNKSRIGVCIDMCHAFAAGMCAHLALCFPSSISTYATCGYVCLTMHLTYALLDEVTYFI